KLCEPWPPCRPLHRASATTRRADTPSSTTSQSLMFDLSIFERSTIKYASSLRLHILLRQDVLVPQTGARRTVRREGTTRVLAHRSEKYSVAVDVGANGEGLVDEEVLLAHPAVADAEALERDVAQHEADVVQVAQCHDRLHGDVVQRPGGELAGAVLAVDVLERGPRTVHDHVGEVLGRASV
ncbi:hypothetical protein PENTCL1PPCAC_906, partial [Pristionchus entomophagus]